MVTGLYAPVLSEHRAQSGDAHLSSSWKPTVCAQETEAKASEELQGHPQLRSEFKASLDYQKPCLKMKTLKLMKMKIKMKLEGKFRQNEWYSNIDS